MKIRKLDKRIKSLRAIWMEGKRTTGMKENNYGWEGKAIDRGAKVLP